MNDEYEEELVSLTSPEETDEVYGDEVRQGTEDERAEVIAAATERYPELGERDEKRSGRRVAWPLPILLVVVLGVAVILIGSGENDSGTDAEVLAAANRRVERLEEKLEKVRVVRLEKQAKAKARARVKAKKEKARAERKPEARIEAKRKAAQEKRAAETVPVEPTPSSTDDSYVAPPTYTPPPAPEPTPTAPAPVSGPTTAAEAAKAFSPIP